MSKSEKPSQRKSVFCCFGVIAGTTGLDTTQRHTFFCAGLRLVQSGLSVVDL